MQETQLSQSQQSWLDHVNTAQQLNISMAAYAKNNYI